MTKENLKAKLSLSAEPVLYGTVATQAVNVLVLTGAVSLTAEAVAGIGLLVGSIVALFQRQNVTPT